MFCPKVPPLTNAGYGIEENQHQLSKICGIWLIFTNVSVLPRSYIKNLSLVDLFIDQVSHMCNRKMVKQRKNLK